MIEDTEPAAICDDCGQHLFPPDDDGLTTVDYGSRDVCQKCLDSDYVFSNVSGEYLPESECIFSDALNDWLPDDDAFTCDDCGDVYHSDDACDVGHGNMQICEGCRDSGEYAYPVDDDCTLYHIEQLYWCDRSEEYFYDADNAPSSRLSEYLHCYSADVLEEIGDRVYTASGSVTMYTAKREKLLCYGVELETGSRDYSSPADIAETICESTDYQEFGICKEDGSIDGAELVTLPATLAAHRTRLDWAAWCEVLRPVARGHHGNAGMHIHVNKSALSPLTLGKLLVFVNNPDNLCLLSTIAQRPIADNGWCDIHPATYNTVGKAGKHGNQSGKYSAVNVTYNTVEFRIFNSNLLPERIIKNLEFCESLIKWCRTVSVRDLNSETYVQYVRDNAKQYPALFQFIATNYNSEEIKLCA